MTIRLRRYTHNGFESGRKFALTSYPATLPISPMLKADSETNNSAAASMRFVLIKVPMDAPAIDLKHLFQAGLCQSEHAGQILNGIFGKGIFYEYW